MNFGKFDMIILVVMSIGIVVMSFVFPALGMTEASTSESDIPEFDMSSDRFDFAGDFPERPGTPSQGTLFHIEDSPDEHRVIVPLQENESYAVNIAIDNVGTVDNPNVTIELREFATDGSLNETTGHLTEEGDVEILENYDYRVRYTWDDTRNAGESDMRIDVTYEVLDQPETGSGWLGRLPIVGSVFSAGEALASTVSWIGSIIWWFFVTLFEVAFNIIGMLFDVVVYLFDTASWLTGTYADIIAGANSWVSVFVAIPGILLFLVFAKMTMIGISLLPTT